MVWSFQYEPKASSFPNAEIVEGNRGHLELVDDSRDGGGSLLGGGQAFSGRRVKPESVPKVIRWLSKRPLLDFESAHIKTVSDRFRTLIEEIEPRIHQFEPVSFIGKDSSPLGTRWFWQINNRLDSVHREKTNWMLQGTNWRSPPRDQGPRLVFDLSKIGDTKFWHDMHLLSASFCSDGTRERLDSEGITGIRYYHYDDR